MKIYRKFLNETRGQHQSITLSKTLIYAKDYNRDKLKIIVKILSLWHIIQNKENYGHRL